MSIKLIAIVFSLLVMPLTARSASIYVGHCLQGCPTGTSSANALLVRNLYAASINQQSRLADWMAYRVLEGTIGVASLLPREWHSDSLLPDGLTVSELDGQDATIRRPNLENQQDRDYRLTEISISPGDRGRLVPMSSFAGTPYWTDLNLLSVMSYMRPGMRSGAWSRLDQAINHLAEQLDEIYVIAGPVFPGPSSITALDAVGNNIPVAFYKIIATNDGRVSAFLMAQDLPSHQAYCQEFSSVSIIESLTGLSFFPQANAWPTGSLNAELGC